MACDIILADKNKEMEMFARKLGFTKLFFRDEINNLGIKEIKDYKEKRIAIEKNKIKVLLNPHLINAKDSLHYRNSGLDQVLCSLMHKNNIAMAFTLNSVNNYIEIGRAMQNIRLCRKYKVKVICFSFANNLHEMRARLDIISFLQVLGMTPGEAKNAFEGPKWPQ